MISSMILGFILVECITALLWVFSHSKNVRKMCSWIAMPLIFVCYILGVVWFCIDHSDESFIDTLFDKETSFFSARKELTEEGI